MTSHLANTTQNHSIAWTFVRRNIVQIIGIFAAIGFGVIAILAYRDQRDGIKLARDALAEAIVANKIAYDALQAAIVANSRAWFDYELNRAQFVYSQMQNCRDIKAVSEALSSGCNTVTSWSNYPSIIASIFSPTGPGTVSPLPTATQTTELLGYYSLAPKGISKTKPTPSAGIAAAILFGLPGGAALAIIAMKAIYDRFQERQSQPSQGT